MIFDNDDDTGEDNHSVIESAEVFSPVFNGKITLEALKKVADSPGFKSLIERADGRVGRVSS
jgi:hypothetical protein